MMRKKSFNFSVMAAGTPPGVASSVSAQ